MDTYAEAELKILMERLTATGLDVVTRIFPQKIIELQQIINDASIPGSPLNPFVLLNGSTRPTNEPPEKKRKLIEHTYLAKSQLEQSPASHIAWPTSHPPGPKSRRLEEAYSIIKAESSAIVQLTDQALAWFLCKGKNPCSKTSQDSQVIQEELLCELHRAQEAGINIHSSITKSHLTRADLCSKIADHPEIEDYMSALQHHDEHQILLLRQNIRDFRNIYITLYDLVKAVPT